MQWLTGRLENVDIRVRVSGGGHTSQIYAIRQAIAKSIVSVFKKSQHCRIWNDFLTVYIREGRLLPKIRRRTFKESTKAGIGPVRQDAIGGR